MVIFSFLADYSLNWAEIMLEEAVINVNTELKLCAVSSLGTLVVCLITYDLL